MHPLKTAVAAAATLLITTSACGGQPEQAAAATDQTPDTSTQARAFPGASGEIAAIHGRTLQVQNAMDGQVAVTWTGGTTFTSQVKATREDLEIGDCVMVVGEGDDGVTAQSVRITAKVDGSCAPAMRGGPRTLTEGEPPADRPSGLPSDRASGGPGRVMLGGAFGEVTALDGDTLTVETSGPADPTTRTVTTTAGTTWTDTVSATEEALQVGRCVNAEGDKDDTGAVTATTVAVSDPVDGECGFGAVRRMAQP